MRHVKLECTLCPPDCGDSKHHRVRDWEMHPSWIAGIEGLNAYSNWVSSVVMPIAFQWIEEHKAEVYATVAEKYKDDVGVVMAAAFKLVKELPAYKRELERSAEYDAALEHGTLDPSKLNPVWTGIVEKVRAETKEAFEEQAELLGDAPC
jgi:hypothetical protein